MLHDPGKIRETLIKSNVINQESCMDHITDKILIFIIDRVLKVIKNKGSTSFQYVNHSYEILVRLTRPYPDS